MSARPKIIVTGATGWIGRHVCLELDASKRRVIAVDLGPERTGPWESFLSGNIADDAFNKLADDSRLAGAAALIHCAGYAHRPIETPEEVERFYAINRDGSGRVIELAKRLGVERIVYVSSIAFYRWGGAGLVTEDGPVDARTAYADSKMAGEGIFRQSGLDWRSVRLATVFGEGDRANFAKLARALARRRFIVPGRGTARKSVLPVGLAAKVLARLAVEPAPKHRLMNVALPEAPHLREICDAFAAACGFPRPPALPLVVMRALACCGDLAATVRPNFPLTTVNLRKLTTSTVVDTNRFEESFPDLARGTFREALGDCAGYYRELGR